MTDSFRAASTAIAAKLVIILNCFDIDWLEVLAQIFLTYFLPLSK
jgi:hypothetical protein